MTDTISENIDPSEDNSQKMSHSYRYKGRQLYYSQPAYRSFYERVNPPEPATMRLQIILFILTFLSTLFIGAFNSGATFSHLSDIIKGFPYALSLMGILVVHESGHYLASRQWGVHATLPYFIPAPFTLLGTFGAVIKIKSPIPNRRALMDIGAIGPVTGFLIAVVVSIIGLQFSTVVDTSPLPEQSSIVLGDNILFKFLSYLIIGTLDEGKDIYLHPVAFAGWIGMFITALNLLPIGQFDGGHVLYGLSSKWYHRLRYFVIVILVVLGIKYWMGWLVFAFLGSLLGLRHPPPIDPYSPLDRQRKILGIVTILIFILCFIPVPIKLV